VVVPKFLGFPEPQETRPCAILSVTLPLPLQYYELLVIFSSSLAVQPIIFGQERDKGHNTTTKYVLGQNFAPKKHMLLLYHL